MTFNLYNFKVWICFFLCSFFLIPLSQYFETDRCSLGNLTDPSGDGAGASQVVVFPLLPHEEQDVKRWSY